MTASLLLGLTLAAGAADDPKPALPKADAPKAPDLRPKPPAPVTPEKLDSSIRRGVEYLLSAQNKDGSFGSPALKGGVEIYAGIGTQNSYAAATSALCVSALIEAGGDNPDVIKAIEKGEAFLMVALPKEKRDDPTLINNVWAHAYGIQALVRMHARLPDDKDRKKKIEELIRDQYAKLGKYESAQGGWGYYDFNSGTQRPASDSTSFVNAAVLVAMHEAKAIGVEPPPKLLKRGIQMTLWQRQPDGTYLYGTYLKNVPTMGINRPPGSLGRSVACNAALRLWGEKVITDKVLAEWMDRLIVKNGWLSVGRKTTIPHESFFQVAGYFYYFGHYYAALTIPLMPAADRPLYQDHLANILMDLQGNDGSWLDYLLYDYGKQYGTAFAVMSLQACKKAEKK